MRNDAMTYELLGNASEMTSAVLIGVAFFAIHLAKEKFQRLEWAKVL